MRSGGTEWSEGDRVECRGQSGVRGLSGVRGTEWSERESGVRGTDEECGN